MGQVAGDCYEINKMELTGVTLGDAALGEAIETDCSKSCIAGLSKYSCRYSTRLECLRRDLILGIFVILDIVLSFLAMEGIEQNSVRALSS